MDNYEYTDAPAPKQSAPLEMWDLLSILMLLLTLCIGIYFTLIFFFPNSALNPLPPNPVDPNAPPTPTITPIQLEPTWTVTPINATGTATLVPTITLEPSPTSFSLVPPTKTPTFTPTPRAAFGYTINVLQSDITIPHLQPLGCSWQGVGGSVVGTDNGDRIGDVVVLSGTLGGKSVHPSGSIIVASGMSPDYGRSGFEISFSNTLPIASKGTLFIQLFDQQTGQPLSERIPIETFDDCKKNLILVRFKKN